MDLYEILDQVLALLRARKRVSYLALRRYFALDDDTLETLKAEIQFAHPEMVDEGGYGLVWKGEGDTEPRLRHVLDLTSPSSEAERRQLTVMFCDVVDSTPLASQLDPEDLREIIQAYQAVCTEIIQRFEGHVAQYLGDGLLVYFGYPQAHEDDAHRAVRTGLGIVQAMDELNARLMQERGLRLAIRVGIHTGLVVVGDVGGGGRQEQLALGETPNLAARIQALAAPDAVVISATTFRLMQGLFECRELGPQRLKGVTNPVRVYHVVREHEAQSRLEVAGPTGLTPLVGREEEVGLLLARWAQVKEGSGQVVSLSGEAGIGKSRLLQVLKDHIASEPHLRWECRCSPYHQSSAFYPWIDLWRRLLGWTSDDTAEDKLRKLEAALMPYTVSLPDAVPLLATLLSLPLPDHSPPLTLPPQQLKQKILEAVLNVLQALAAKQPMLFIVEDLHWADPSTLELVGQLMDQGPTARILTLLVFRPEFQPPWDLPAHVTPMTLVRLSHHQTEILVERVAGGKELPAEVGQQIVAKTDGVPLFVEELTKMVLESGWLRERASAYELTRPLPALAIPATLHDSLMARLDRLGSVKEVAQLGATLGRAFRYDLLQAIAPWDEATLQQALGRLVETELLYQRGDPPQATYIFKHALIQEVAYQSLLKSRRQQAHHRIAQVLEAQFPDIAQTQPELLAHHYSEAGLSAPAVPYWQRAGERALQRSANLEAISHLTRGLEVLTALDDTPERAQQELSLQIALGPALIAAKGYSAPDVANAYTRARELCRQVGETPQLFPALWGLWVFSFSRAELQTARELGERLFRLAQRLQAPALRLEAHQALGQTLFFLGELAAARAHVEQGVALYNPQQHRAQAFLYGSFDPQVVCLSYTAWALWALGYPEQALKRSQEALARGQELAHPPTLAAARHYATIFRYFRREMPVVHAQAEELMHLSEGLPYWLALGTFLQGWACVAQGQCADGIALMHQGLAARQAMGTEVARPLHLAMMAEAYRDAGQPAEGRTLLAEALAAMHSTGERWWEAELYRLKGELLLARSADHAAEADTCFRQALNVSRRQQAKSLELRAALSLSQLWQQQGKHTEARELLVPIYSWFTEGFDTADLQDAKVLLHELT